jgi:hypothetical protein
MEELRAIRAKQNSMKVNEKAEILTKKIEEISRYTDQFSKATSSKENEVNQAHESSDEEEEESFGPSADFQDKTANDLSLQMPVSHEATLKHGTKTVSAITVDSNGGRMATGGYDYEVKLWDFGSMDSTLRYFRQFQPMEWFVLLIFHCDSNGIECQLYFETLLVT